LKPEVFKPKVPENELEEAEEERKEAPKRGDPEALLFAVDLTFSAKVL